MVFNPRYVLTLAVSLFTMSSACISQKSFGSFSYLICILILFGLVLLGLIIIAILRAKLKKLFNDKKHNVVKEYRKTNYYLTIIISVKNAALCLAIIWLLGGAFLCPEIKELLKRNNEMVQQFRALSDAFKEVGGIYTVVYLLWLIASSAVMHWAIKFYVDSQMLTNERLDYFRVIVNKQMTYVILAPTFSNRNGICIAVRTSICRKKNGIVVGNLILDDVITQKTPYEGESFLVGIDSVNCILQGEYQSALLSDHEIKQILINEKMDEYLSFDRNWLPLIEKK